LEERVTSIFTLEVILQSSAYQLDAGYFLGIFSDAEDGGKMFL
jgi:hypothetical protein